MSDFQRYEFSVLQVCEDLNGYIRGTRDGGEGGLVALRQRAKWLEWRIFEAWDEPKSPFDAYDITVRSLAMYALELWNKRQL